jgi:hypothetical protein
MVAKNKVRKTGKIRKEYNGITQFPINEVKYVKGTILLDPETQYTVKRDSRTVVIKNK